MCRYVHINATEDLTVPKSASDPVNLCEPSSWDPSVQVNAKIPSDAWEYHIRKSRNDAAYNGLEYVAYCSAMPVQREAETPQFLWVSHTR